MQEDRSHPSGRRWRSGGEQPWPAASRGSRGSTVRAKDAVSGSPEALQSGSWCSAARPIRLCCRERREAPAASSASLSESRVMHVLFYHPCMLRKGFCFCCCIMWCSCFGVSGFLSVLTLTVDHQTHTHGLKNVMRSVFSQHVLFKILNIVINDLYILLCV